MLGRPRAPIKCSVNGPRYGKRKTARRFLKRPRFKCEWRALQPTSTRPELLLRRAVHVTDAPAAYSPDLLARSVRDYARVSELMIGAIDTLVALSGTAGFASSHPLQRAWRDIHFMSMHISLNVETNFAHYGRMQLGLGPEPTGRYF